MNIFRNVQQGPRSISRIVPAGSDSAASFQHDAMPFFSGQSSTRRVDLRGKSRTEETREQTLERTRKEREARRVNRLNQDSAKKIQVTRVAEAPPRDTNVDHIGQSNTSQTKYFFQATWRGRQAVSAQRVAVRVAWEARFGEAGCRAGYVKVHRLSLSVPLPISKSSQVALQGE